MMITSTSNEKIVKACLLKEKKYRDIENKFLIEGYHLLSMAKNIETIFTIDTNYTNNNVEVVYVNEKVIDKLSSTKNSQGIVAICNKIDEKIDFSDKRFLLLDNVSDPGNLGTIIRSCLAFNVKNIILSENSVDIYNDKVIRSSQGAIFNVKFLYANILDVIKKLQDNNINVYASCLHENTINLNSIDHIDNFALIVGNEANGISKEVIEASNFKVKINHSDEIESLNVGVATSIMLYYFDKIINK